MAYIDNFEDLQLKGVTELNCDELGRGAYGRVYAVKYCQTTCAAKEIHYSGRGSWASGNAVNYRIVYERVSTMQYVTSS